MENINENENTKEDGCEKSSPLIYKTGEEGDHASFLISHLRFCFGVLHLSDKIMDTSLGIS